MNDGNAASSWSARAAHWLARAEDYLKRSRGEQDPVVQLRPPRALLDEWGLAELLRQPEGASAADLDALVENYWQASTRVHDPRFMAHQVAVPQPLSAVGDFVHGLSNNGHATYEMGPQAVAVEFAVVDWMLEQIGWSAGSGMLVHGGSLANLSCLLAARATAFPEAWERGVPAGAALLTAATSHYSVARCAGILGTGTDAVCAVGADARGVLRPAALEHTLRERRDAGQPILAVVANACATATGLYDPLHELAPLCREHGVWLHVDGCHGASVLLSARHRQLVRGLEQADSVSWDVHKMLGASALVAGALFREPDAVYRAFRQDGNYLAGSSAEERPFLRSIECTKSGLGMRALLALAARGSRGLEADLDQMHANARTLHRLLSEAEDFEVPFTPESNILLFRPRPVGAELSDTTIEALRRRLMDAGSYYLTAADFAGRKWLRVTLMNPATTEGHLRGMLQQLRESGPF